MTLRTRTVIAILALAAVGLAAFGTATYTLYRRSLEQQLDEDLLASARGQQGRLIGASERATFDPATCTPTSDPGDLALPGLGFDGSPGQGLDAYSELRDSDGTVLACALPVSTDSRPDLADELTADGEVTYLDVGSSEGTGTWRVLVLGVPDVPNLPGDAPSDLADVFTDTDRSDQVTVVAVRTAGLDASLRRLVQIEVGAALVVLGAIGVGAWLLLRRGLRPLEQMADTATAITAGDLSHRVEPATDATEVGRLGLALNTMLDGIEGAFREREATEARLRQFLADASHELRTPLTSIQGFAELHRMADDDAPDREVPIARIEQEANRMRLLVEDLLLLARLDEPRHVATEPVDLTIVAAEACDALTATGATNPITLEAPRAVVADAVGEHLHRALLNLLTNAVRHTPPGTPIEVTATTDGSGAIVRVRDHGPGLDDDALAHALDRFWQADPARSGAGSGLGLAIVASIALEHDGTLIVENRADGGASFELRIPMRAHASTAAQDSA
ncbi:MAG: HAMP domain-containing histidine kinase [Acidimicrobiales bacterium]|nr:HAMP domain-containing histidine kinase [Acidimicrobiales bacterium]